MARTLIILLILRLHTRGGGGCQLQRLLWRPPRELSHVGSTQSAGISASELRTDSVQSISTIERRLRVEPEVFAAAAHDDPYWYRDVRSTAVGFVARATRGIRQRIPSTRGTTTAANCVEGRRGSTEQGTERARVAGTQILEGKRRSLCDDSRGEEILSAVAQGGRARLPTVPSVPCHRLEACQDEGNSCLSSTPADHVKQLDLTVCSKGVHTVHVEFLGCSWLVRTLAPRISGHTLTHQRHLAPVCIVQRGRSAGACAIGGRLLCGKISLAHHSGAECPDETFTNVTNKCGEVIVQVFVWVSATERVTQSLAAVAAAARFSRRATESSGVYERRQPAMASRSSACR